MQLPLTVPGLLADSIGGKRTTQIDASTLADALEKVRAKFPLLRTHVWDEAMNVREHVLIYLNDESVTWIDDHAGRALRKGDELFIIQAVSGG